MESEKRGRQTGTSTSLLLMNLCSHVHRRIHHLQVNENPHSISFVQSTDPLPENSIATTNVGVVSAQDVDFNDTHTFTLDAQAPNAAFALSSDGVLTV